MRQHEPITLRNFLGTYDRGEDDVVPPGFFRSSQNVRFTTGGVQTREGSTLDITIGSVKRMAVYKRIGEAQRLLLLAAGGNLYDSTNLVTPILSIAAMTDFSVVSLFNRAYITPHNGQTGLPGEKVYVYSGSGVARPAAGTPPSAFTLTLSEPGASGNCEAGLHLYGVAFETDTGYVTAPGGFQQINQSGAKTTRAANLPIGPAGTAARVLVATKRIVGTFNGDFQNQTYYLVPNGRVAGNVAVSVDVSFFDADLAADVSYLLDQLSTLPAGVGIGSYNGRLTTWGEDVNPSVVRVSASGQPESFSAPQGFVTVNPGDSGGGIKKTFVYRNQLICCKSQRTYITQDNDNDGAFWPVRELDMSKGTECHGVGTILDFGENIEDRVFVADRAGLQLFNGTFSDAELTYNIMDIWNRINQVFFHTIEVAVDPVDALVYCAVPLDAATSPSHLIVGDFNEGLSPDKIKFTIWAFPVAPQTIVVDVDNATKKSLMKYGVSAGNVYKMDRAVKLDFGNAIDSWVQFPHLPAGDDETVYHFGGVGLRVKGVGNLQITTSSLDDVRTLTSPSLPLAALPGRTFTRGMNFQSESASVKLRTNAAGEYFILNRFTLYQKPLWAMRPES
jgi:hypothetical protein